MIINQISIANQSHPILIHSILLSIISNPSRRRHSWRPRQVYSNVRRPHLRNQSSGRHQARLGRQIERRLRGDIARTVYRSGLTHFGLVITLFEGLGGRGFSSEGDNVLSTDDDKSKGALDLFLLASFAGLGDSVFLCICEDDVHMLIEGEEGTHHHAGILNGDPDSKVDPLQELAPLCGHRSQIYNRLWIAKISRPCEIEETHMIQYFWSYFWEECSLTNSTSPSDDSSCFLRKLSCTQKANPFIITGTITMTTTSYSTSQSSIHPISIKIRFFNGSSRLNQKLNRIPLPTTTIEFQMRS